MEQKWISGWATKKIKTSTSNNQISSTLLLISIILLSYSTITFFIESYSGFITGEFHTGNYFNTFIAQTILSIIGFIKIIPLFISIYLILENHMAGIKISMVYGFFGLLYNHTKIDLVLISSLLCIGSGIFAWMNRREVDEEILDDKRIIEDAVIKILQSLSYFTILVLSGMVLYMLARAYNYLTLEFIFAKFRDYTYAAEVISGVREGTVGGISEFIIGSLILTTLAVSTAAPIGVATAVYLAEYAPDNWLTNFVRQMIETLAGVPSLLMGFVAWGFFAQAPFLWGKCLMTGWVAVTAVILPWIIRVSEEAIQTVPESFKEASYALGATKWQTVKKITIRAAAPGIITGVVLGIGKSFGEAAVPLMAAGNSAVQIPGGLGPNIRIFRSPWPTLPVWVYKGYKEMFTITAPGTVGEAMWMGQNVVFAGAVVLLSIFLMISLGALYIRNYLMKKSGMSRI